MHTYPNMINTEDNDARLQLERLMNQARAVMLITLAEDGALRGRPMVPRPEAYGETLWFATRTTTDKAREVAVDPRALVSYQSGLTAAVVSGRATLVHDAASRRAVWTDKWQLWFPEGPESPEIDLIRFDATHIELWDANGTATLSLAWERVKSTLTGTAPNPRAAVSHLETGR